MQRVLNIPRRLARSLMSANQYQSRMFLSADMNVPDTTEDDNTKNNDEIAQNEEKHVFEDRCDVDYSHYISEKPDSEFGRKMRIVMPAKAAGTQGVAKVGMWKVEPMNPGKRWGNPLMGWTSTRDPMNAMNHGLDRFASKEHAIEWCVSNGLLIFICDFAIGA